MDISNLKIYTDRGLGLDNPPFHDIEVRFSGQFARMGMPQLTASFKYPKCLDDEWTGREYVMFRGEKFYIKAEPSSAKDNTDARYTHNINFVPERAGILSNIYFHDAVYNNSYTKDKPCSSSTEFKFFGNIREFVDRLNCAFRFSGIGDSILETKTDLTTEDKPNGDGFCAMLDPLGDYDRELVKEFDVTDKNLWEVISEGFSLYKIPFELVGKAMVFGAIPKTVSKVFKYGVDNELLSVKKNNVNAKVINRITMLGSSDNIPYYYPNESEYGHIKLFVGENNRLITLDMVEVVNMTQMLSRMSADEPAVFTKNNKAVIKGCQMGFDNNSMKDYNFIGAIEYNRTNTASSVISWEMRFDFNISQKDFYSIKEIKGQAFFPNATEEQNDTNILNEDSKVWGLWKVLSSGDKEMTSQAIVRDDKTVELGCLDEGDYYIYLRCYVPVRYAGPVHFLLRGLTIRATEGADYYWKTGDNIYNLPGYLGVKIHLEKLADYELLEEDDYVGDSFGWTAEDRVEFQKYLMPPKYRKTLGADRHYDAKNINLLKASNVAMQSSGDYLLGYYHYDRSIKKGEDYTVTICYQLDDSQPDSIFFVSLYGGNLYQTIRLENHGGVHIQTEHITVEREDYAPTINFYNAPYNGSPQGGYPTGGKILWAVINKGNTDGVNAWLPCISESNEYEYINPDTNEPYVFDNTYIEEYPSEHIYRDETIKPTIEGIENAAGELIGEIAEIAYDSDDNDSLKQESTDDDKNDATKYEHSFFYLKLHIFNGEYGFDLLKHSIQSEPMVIQMTSGPCNGCKFKIQVEKKTNELGIETFTNPVLTNESTGELFGGNYANKVKLGEAQEWQQNTETNSIWICVQKDAETFGVIMPNHSNKYMPKIGDKFNITGIQLPHPYIEKAEKELEEAGIAYMADNNDDKFKFEISLSRIFLKENPDILDELDEYSLVQVEYNNRIYTFNVSTLSINYKERDILPDINITLEDITEESEDFVRSVTESVSQNISQGTSSSGGTGADIVTLDKRFLRKDKSEITPFRLTSDTGFEVGRFLAGMSGGIFGIDSESGKSLIEVDYLTVRMKAIFEELMISKISSVKGQIDISPGGSIDLTYVEEKEDRFRCYFKGKDEDKGSDCSFVAGDIVRCKEFNVSNGRLYNATNQSYSYIVLAVDNTNAFVDLKKANAAFNSTKPKPGDTVCHYGNISDNKRQNVISLSTVSNNAPSITLFNGINSCNPNMLDKDVISMGYDRTALNPEPFFNCYGRAYIGLRDKSSYLNLRPLENLLEFRGRLHIKSTVGDKTLEDILNGSSYLEEALHQDTLVDGGLIMTSLISLGVTDASDITKRKTWAGINGIRKNDKSISSWWGGEMVDKYFFDDGTMRDTALSSGYAAALVRMDGSAYFSNGNIGFNADGSGWLGNISNGISFSSDGEMTFGSGIKIAETGDQSETLSSLANFMIALSTFIKPCDSNLVPLSWVDALKSDTDGGYKAKSLMSRLGFWSESFISARGRDNEGGGSTGGGGAANLYDLNDVSINNPTTGQSLVYNGELWVNQTTTGGFDETALAQYLNENGYATSTWISNNYLSLAGGTMKNSTVVNNLNADMIDGNHIDSLFRQLGTNPQLNEQSDYSNKNGIAIINAAFDGFSTTGSPFSYGSFLCLNQDNHSVQIGFNSDDATINEPVFRQRWWSGGGNKWTEWKKLAFTSSNVYSATRLQTARTIWGQSFDGTDNITGNLINVGTIQSNGYAIADNYSDVWDDGTNTHPWYGLDHRFSGNDVYSTVLSDYDGMIFKTRLGELCITTSGRVGINTTAPTNTLDVNGTIRSSVGILSDGYITCRATGSTSDERLKKNFRSFDVDIDKIANAPSYLFDWKSDNKEDSGSIAQYWADVIPHVVYSDSQKHLSLQYGKAALLSVIAIAKEIQMLRKENSELRE